jgi:hypothetical protein
MQFFKKIREGFDVSPPGAFSNLLGYQSVNVIDPSYSEFMRNFIIGDYHLSVYGTKRENLIYSVQYTKVYADGRTYWYTEILNLDQINELLDRFEGLDRQTERKLDAIEAVKQAGVDRQITEYEEKINTLSKQIPPAKMRSRGH